MNCTVANTTTNLEGTRGWVRQSNDRGTLDIIISCCITIFLCIWTSVCVNVPAPEHGMWSMLRDRWHMFCLGLLGPEFILLCAVGQYCSARASFHAFARTKHEGWTMKHAFFADMGGIHLQFQDVRSFPVNAKQLHFLVASGYISYPKITTNDINDKNKADGLARMICTLQIFWFTLSTVSRPIARYAVTTLELTTLAYILCALATLFFWRHKPMDIRTPIMLECSTPIGQITDRWGRAATGSYHYTPLDFVSRGEWIGTRLWTYYVNLLRQMGVVHYYPPELPVRSFSSFNFPIPTRPMLFAMLGISFGYTGIFVAGWNLHYPSLTERLLWRICTLGTMIITVIGGLFEVIMMLRQYQRRHSVSVLVHNPDIEVAPTHRGHRKNHSMEPTRLQVILQNIRNNTPDKDPHFDIPIRSLVITTPLCALYCIFRAFILIEDIISLRELPGSAFAAIEWSMYVPHI
ncbi:hypothetical protein K458DRAFT_438759 [Lentithecium fluviatile CBS 122367]|uniref:Uncharacterized protein n=1 Tax=Lentithecium fluviatile CBS 122367 TaxID=1168545 RepID=A0A6G1JKG6_9PLEO|nr:hypothetical protein K458DRAFT_438759 [Lentithecium fluviatile CBS 122367]